jgi:methylated-DNA-[protein]-cysteine S-methyltransferase
MIQLTTMDSPIGSLTIAARGGRVCLLHFGADGPDARAILQRWYFSEPVELHPDPARAVAALRRYFDGKTSALDGITVEMNGTPFQKKVWEALRGVKAGTTTSYASIAQRIGAPSAVRAVGAANGRNPVALIVPCHRIIGTNGSLTGYGGGLERKRWLLQHEGVLLPT